MKKIKYYLSIGLFIATFQLQAAIIIGNPKGDITLVEVMSYQCVHCHNMGPIIDALREDEPRLKIKIIPIATNKEALLETAGAYAVFQDNPTIFEQYHQKLLTKRFSESETLAYLKTLPIHQKDVEADMHSPRVLKEIMTGINLLNIYQSGTPLLLIYPSQNPEDLKVIRGEVSLIDLKKAIKEIK